MFTQQPLQEYRIIVGTGKDRHGVDIPYDSIRPALHTVHDILVRDYGGFTEYEHTGGWASPQADVILESGRTFSVLITPTNRNPLEVAEEIGRLLNQHSVAVIGPDGQGLIIEVGYAD